MPRAGAVRISFEEETIYSLLQQLCVYNAVPVLTREQSLGWTLLNWNEFCPTDFLCAQSLEACRASVVVRAMAVESVRCLPWRMDIRKHVPLILRNVLTGAYTPAHCFCNACLCHERVSRYIRNVSDLSRVPPEYRHNPAVAASSGFWAIAACIARTPLWDADPLFGCLCHPSRPEIGSHVGLTCAAAAAHPTPLPNSSSWVRK